MESTNKNILDAQKLLIDRIYQAIDNLGILTITDCIGVNPQGFVIEAQGIEVIENLKPLISDGALCVCYVQKVEESDYLGDISEFIGQEKIIDVYIRLDLTNTWIYINFKTVVCIILEELFEVNYGEDDDESEYEDNIDYERLNRISTIVAKSKGFNFLKNRDQRKDFSKEILGNTKEEFSEHELYGIAANAESFYDFGVLPIEAKKLQDEGVSAQAIAKKLGHTKAKIERALLIEVPDVIKACIEKYEEDNLEKIDKL